MQLANVGAASLREQRHIRAEIELIQSTLRHGAPVYWPQWCGFGWLYPTTDGNIFFKRDTGFRATGGN